MLLTRLPLGAISRHLARLACVMHSASVNSEPGSNSPFKFGRFCGGKTLATSACIENEEELTLLCSCCSSIVARPAAGFNLEHTPNDSLRPLFRGEEQGAHSLAKSELSKSKKLILASCIVSRNRGQFFLPLGRVLRRGLSGEILA